ncbi:hypothetical protein G6F56_002086 [Rhizopus delemar]|nr:hypothetical protein G6F56_002086 [Rhizopus delemar]
MSLVSEIQNSELYKYSPQEVEVMASPPIPANNKRKSKQYAYSDEKPMPPTPIESTESIGSTESIEPTNTLEELSETLLKRHSTISSIKEEAISHSPSMNSLARHHTTGHTLKSARQQLAEKSKKDLMRRSEDFQKELQARRKAFKKFSKDEDDNKVMIGTQISEGHRNYVLMYNMLTGIRIAVSRVTAKMDRELVDEDFVAAHKLAFDVIGDELTPGAKYDFKFKDYAPWVFRHLREKLAVDPADYLHISNNPNTLLCRYYGLHRIKLPHGKKIHFVVMSNVFPPNKDIHETYDLKGSTLGRFLPEEEILKNPYAVMKDLNWEKQDRKLHLGPEKRKLFMTQIVRDVTLLSQLNIMDYSLLVGIHDMLRGNKDNIRATLQTFQPNTKSIQRRITQMRRRTSKAQVVRRAIAEANPDKLDISQLPKHAQERRHCIFYAEEGGLRATDESNQPLPVLYSLGIIDILTPYDIKKKSEHVYKSLTTHDKYAISAIRPSQYGQRFLEFMARAVLEHNQDIPQEYKLKSRSKHFFK